MFSSLTDDDRASLEHNRLVLFHILMIWIDNLKRACKNAGCAPDMTIQQILVLAVEEYNKNMLLFGLPIDKVISRNLDTYEYIFEKCYEIHNVIAGLKQIQKDLRS